MIIFISHSSHDDPFVDWLRKELHQRGYRTWVDHVDIPAGKLWDEVVEDRLLRCSTMILVLSPEGVASQEVGVEWREFRRQKKKIIPIKIKDCPVPLLIRDVQHIDFVDASMHDEQPVWLVDDLPPPTIVTRDLNLDTREMKILELKEKTETLSKIAVGKDQILFAFAELDRTGIFDLDKDKLFIGWYDKKTGLKPDIDLARYGAVLEHGVSRQHALLSRTTGGLTITDLSSRNGTYIDDKQLPPEIPYPLQSNIILRLGSLAVRVFYRDQKSSV